jgi:hypothetical protein
MTWSDLAMLAMFYGMPIWFALPLALLCEAVIRARRLTPKPALVNRA